MEISGRLIQNLAEQRGTTARGEWVRGGFVIETDGEYPKKIAFTIFGEERLAMAKNFKIGDAVKVTFSIESREYPAGSGKWFSDVRCIRIQNPYANAQAPQVAQVAQAPQAAPATNATQQQFAQSAITQQAPMSGDDDLPF